MEETTIVCIKYMILIPCSLISKNTKLQHFSMRSEHQLTVEVGASVTHSVTRRLALSLALAGAKGLGPARPEGGLGAKLCFTILYFSSKGKTMSKLNLISNNTQ